MDTDASLDLPRGEFQLPDKEELEDVGDCAARGLGPRVTAGR